MNGVLSLVDNWCKEKYPNITNFYFSDRNSEILDKVLEENLKSYNEFKESSTFLYPQGFDADKCESFYKTVLPVYDEEGRYYGEKKISEFLSKYLPLYFQETPFNPRAWLLVESDCAICFPPYEWKEKWYKVDVGFSEGWCIWDKEGILSNFTKKKLKFFSSFQVSRDGFLEITGVLVPMIWDENLKEIDDEEIRGNSDAITFLYPELHEWILFNRFQLLYYTGRISKEDFVKFYVNIFLVSSMFRVRHPVYIGRKAYLKLIENVLIPTSEQIDTGKAIIELNDFREFGLIEEQQSSFTDLSKATVPVRITIYDWEKTAFFPIPSRAGVFGLDRFWSYPLPEEVEAILRDIALHDEKLVKELEEKGHNRKGSPYYERYLELKRNIQRERDELPAWWRQFWNRMKMFSEE